MLYEPVKDILIGLAGRSQLLRRLYYVMLNVVFLRSWYVRRTIRGLLSESVAESTRVLDAGTGLGQFAYYAASRNSNVRVHAVDLNDRYLEYARRFISRTRCAPRVTYGVEDLTRLKTAGPYDLILSVDVMEHIEDDVGVFRHFARVLRPGGHLVVNTPSDLGGSDVRKAGEESFIGEHVRDGYSQEELSTKLQSVGLQVTAADYTYGKAGALAWRLLIKIPMQLISASRLLAVIAVPYFLLVLPAGIVLNAIDMHTTNETGTGILVVARK